MKVAIIIAGEPRFCKEFDLFIDNLIGYTQVDWYFYLWNESQVHPSIGNELVAPSWNKINEEWAFKKIRENLPDNHNIAKLVVADQNNFNFTINTDPGRVGWMCRPAGIWKQWCVLKEADLFRRSQNYDLVIRTRNDMGVTPELNLNNIMSIIENNPNTIIMPKTNWFGGANDLFAISSAKNMEIYFNLVDYIEEYHMNHNCIYGSESLLAHHLRHHGLNSIPGDFETPLRSLGKWRAFPEGPYWSNFGRWE